MHLYPQTRKTRFPSVCFLLVEASPQALCGQELSWVIWAFSPPDVWYPVDLSARLTNRRDMV